MKILFLTSPIIAGFLVLNSWAHNAPASTPPPNSLLERLTTLTDSDSRPWTAEQFATMGRIRDAAMLDPNAYNMLAHLTDNIGPRLSGLPQAEAAVEWVAAKMREMGTSVTLEKTTVPHWVRGKEDAVLTVCPGMPSGTTQKIDAHRYAGDREGTLAWLAIAAKERDPVVCHLRSDPRWEPHRSDPRFQAIARDVGLA